MKQEWEIKRLGDVVKTGAGGTPRKSHEEYYEGGTIPWLLSGEVSQGLIYKSKNFITTKGLENSSAKLFPINTVLVAMYGATVGQVGILKCEAATNQAVCGILPNDVLSPEFLYYFFLSKKDDFIAQAVGNAQPNISQIKIKNTEIPVPPLETQKQIVEVLDKAFAAIDLAKANIEKNLQNAKELFQSKLNQIFTQKGEGWERQRVDEVTRVVNGFSFKSKDFSPRNTVKSIKITNVGVQEFVEDTDSNLPESFLDTYKSVRVTRGDLVLALTRTIISSGLKVAIIPESFDGALLNQRVAAISPNNEIIKAKFLYYFFCSECVSDYVLSNVNTLMQPNLSIKDLKRMEVPVPSMIEQQNALVEISLLVEMTGVLQDQYKKKLLNLEELKKSILQKTFSGELI